MRFEPVTERRVAVGVDLGQSKDPTSVAVVERVRTIVPTERTVSLRAIANGAERLAAMQSELEPERFNLRLLEQAPLGEPYPAQALRIKRILSRQQIAAANPRVYMDFTGVGRPMYDIMRREGVPNLVPVTISFQGGGANAAGGQTVPKLELVSRLQALMHTGRLHMPDETAMPLAKVFRRELLDFRVTYTPVGNATFGAREGAHDDLILAVALAVWGLTRPEIGVWPLRI